jgi:murein DD-endopeptidase MepM/ murein hydrolase activator NlpD
MAKKKKRKSSQSLRERLEQRAACKDKSVYAEPESKYSKMQWENLPASFVQPMREHLFEKTVAAIIIVICLGLFSLLNLPLTNRVVDAVHYLTVHQMQPAEMMEAAKPVLQSVREFEWRRSGDINKEDPSLPPVGEQTMAAPVNGVLSSPYGTRLDSAGQTEMHYGIDVVTEPDAPVFAAFSGTVTLVREHPVYGLAIYVEHPGNMVTIYGRVSEPLVKAGDRVARGQKLAQVAAVTGGESHLHFEVWQNSVAVNPEEFIIDAE